MWNLWSNKFLSTLKTILFFLLLWQQAFSQDVPVWSVNSYPDEAGYMQRTAGMLQVIAKADFGKRSLARSTCPDTGLPVYRWALEGETIISPYTGKIYQQGETGYFGPKKRNSLGEITMFGGDPLKYDLPPVTAKMLLGEEVERAKAFLSIPGNISQHYHFAAVNWARFYPLFSEKMGDEWIKDFAYAVDQYRENRRPSDGYRQYISDLSVYHTLLGEQNEFLGGNVKDGGTENHKMMWRTSALLYTDLLPDTAKISGIPLVEAKQRLLKIFAESAERIWQKGNGEYDSGIYYPHSFNGQFNLYDFAKDPHSKRIAKAYLDYYLGTYVLKVFQGVIAGAQKRAALPVSQMGETGKMLWSWTGDGEGLIAGHPHTTIQHATTSYRPNRVIYNLLTKNIQLPFEAEIARPDYHVRDANMFQEYFYCHKDFAMGSVAMTMVDNPNQQLQWSLVVKGKNRPYIFGGGQPFHANWIGHSPYTQTLQKENSILVVSAPTATEQLTLTDREFKNRQEYGGAALTPVPTNLFESEASVAEYLNNAKYSSATWLFMPKEAKVESIDNQQFFITCGEAKINLQSLGKAHLVEAEESLLKHIKNKGLKQRLAHLNVLVCKANENGYSGYVLEVFGASEIENSVSLQAKLLQQGNDITYNSQKGNQLTMEYQAHGLRALGSINGKQINYENWADGGVYKSPYVSLKNGVLKMNDGKEGYSVVWKDGLPVYKFLKMK